MYCNCVGFWKTNTTTTAVIRFRTTISNKHCGVPLTVLAPHVLNTLGRHLSLLTRNKIWKVCKIFGKVIKYLPHVFENMYLKEAENVIANTSAHTVLKDMQLSTNKL